MTTQTNANEIRYITTNDTSDSTVTVVSRHRYVWAAARTGRRVVELTYHRAEETREPQVGDRLGIYHEPSGCEYALAPTSDDAPDHWTGFCRSCGADTVDDECVEGCC